MLIRDDGFQLLGHHVKPEIVGQQEERERQPSQEDDRSGKREARLEGIVHRAQQHVISPQYTDKQEGYPREDETGPWKYVLGVEQQGYAGNLEQRQVDGDELANPSEIAHEIP